MRWRDDIDIYTYDFYMMTYMRVVTLILWVLPALELILRVLLGLYSDVYVAMRPIWMDLGWGHIWAWYMLWCTPVVGGVAGVSTMMNLGRSGDATVLPHGLHKPTLVSDSVYDIWWFYDIKTYMYYILNVYMYYEKKHWWSLTSSWLGVVRKGLG